MTDVKQPPQLLEVPADTPAATCRGPHCGAEIYWIRTRKGKPMPVDCHAKIEGCRPPALTSPGYGVAHWATCRDFEYFRRRPSPPAPRGGPDAAA